jgi:hypothetical protein
MPGEDSREGTIASIANLSVTGTFSELASGDVETLSTAVPLTAFNLHQPFRFVAPEICNQSALSATGPGVEMHRRVTYHGRGTLGRGGPCPTA